MKLAGNIFLLFLVYFIAAKIGLSIGAIHDFAAPVWPPTGIALVSLLLFGYKLWPGIFLGAFLVNFTTGAPAPVSFGIAAGNTLEALAGAFILNKAGFNTPLKRLRDSLSLIIGAAIISTLISPTIGTSSLYLGGLISINEMQEAWFAWWIGDMLGDLVVAPLLLTWFHRYNSPNKLSNSLEAVLAFLTLLLVSSITFRGFLGVSTISLPITYLVIPPLIWISIRFSQRASTTAVFLLSVIAISGTVLDYGIFANPNLSHGLLVLQGFLGVHAATFLILSSTIVEKKELERKKDDFIGVASHELKTPITTLKAYIQLLDKLPHSNLKVAHYIRAANREVDRLIKLVNDLLDFNKVRIDKMHIRPEPFFINELLETVVTDTQIANAKRKIIFSRERKRQIKVFADRYRIEQVIINLLSNAIKFSPNGKPVYVSLYKNARYIRVSIKDHGIGISKVNQREIFGKFFQAKEKSKEVYAGLGLGLYISSEIIKLHNGKIRVESEEGKGSVFSFELPTGKQ